MVWKACDLGLAWFGLERMENQNTSKEIKKHSTGQTWHLESEILDIGFAISWIYLYFFTSCPSMNDTCSSLSSLERDLFFASFFFAFCRECFFALWVTISAMFEKPLSCSQFFFTPEFRHNSLVFFYKNSIYLSYSFQLVCLEAYLSFPSPNHCRNGGCLNQIKTHQTGFPPPLPPTPIGPP